MRLAILVLCALAHAAAAGGSGGGGGAASGAKQAYVSLLYSDSFLLGFRVLGQSLRESGTTRDHVALLSWEVSTAAEATLLGDGWVVRRVDAIPNPGQWTQRPEAHFPQRFWAVYTKLLIWNLTQYETVVYLDADTAVVGNADDLFLCDGLCGVLRHSERLNSGVMVLQPSAEALDAMLAAIADTPSYTGGDQGFLNSIFADFAAAPLFDPGDGQALSAASAWTSTSGLRMGRLPTRYNADLGLFILNSNRWTLPPPGPAILHYTLGPIKPWAWWSNWVLGESGREWQALRERLPAAGGEVAGEDGYQRFARTWLLALPLVLALAALRVVLWTDGLATALRSAAAPLCGGSGASAAAAAASAAPHTKSPSWDAAHEAAQAAPCPASLVPTAAAACIASTLAALGIAAHIVPPTALPKYAWPLMYEWAALLFLLFFCAFLEACLRWGRRSNSGGGGAAAPPPAGPPAPRPWPRTLAHLGVMVVVLGLAPWWPDLLRVQSFAAKVLSTAAAGMLTVVACCQGAASLAAAWFSCGRAERAGGRPPPRGSVSPSKPAQPLQAPLHELKVT